MVEVNKIYNEDCLEGMKTLSDNSVDSVVTDTPYELGFMGKSWDSTGIAYNVEMWKEVLRVLKPEYSPHNTVQPASPVPDKP